MQGLILPPGAFRLLLALAVVASHLSNLDIGRLAVLLFFYLSGYWVTDIWQGKFQARDRLQFYASRFLRIWPLFLIVTVSSALLRGHQLGLTNFTLLGLAASGEASDPTTVSWSLDVELQFYLMAPFLIAGLMKAPRLTAAAAVALLPLGWWLDYAAGGVTVLKFLPAFLLGSATRLARWAPTERMAVLSLAAFAGVSFAVGLSPVMWKSQPDLIDRDMFGLLWMLPLLPYVARSLAVRAGPLDRALGELSFPLYLVHPMVIFAAAGSLSDAKPLLVSASLVVAAAVYYALDRPIDRWRRKVTETQTLRRAPAA